MNRGTGKLSSYRKVLKLSASISVYLRCIYEDHIITTMFFLIQNVTDQRLAHWTFNTMTQYHLFLILCCVCAMHLGVSFIHRTSSIYIARSLQPVPSSCSRTRAMSLRMVLGGIAEKMGSIVEFISGQSKITEANIEDTLKVSGDGNLS